MLAVKGHAMNFTCGLDGSRIWRPLRQDGANLRLGKAHYSNMSYVARHAVPTVPLFWEASEPVNRIRSMCTLS